MTGWLQRRFGFRRYFAASILLFTFASALCGLAWSLPSLVAFRALQGLGGGAIIPTAQTILFTRYPKEETNMAGALFGIFNRGVFPDFAYWTKSSEVLIMTLLGGMGSFWGPAVGAAALIWLNQQIVSYTEYWPLVLGTILVVLLFVFPGGIAGAVTLLLRRSRPGVARA